MNSFTLLKPFDQEMNIVDPIKLSRNSGSNALDNRIVLSDAQVQQWREQGYLLLDNVFPECTIINALEEIKELQMMSKKGTDDFEVGDGKTFPTCLNSLDAITLDTSLIGAIKQVLNKSEIRMCQAETWKKVAHKEVSLEGEDVDRTYSNQDQRMHMDFPNHTLLHPPAWETPEAVAVIVYLTDCKECGGATRTSITHCKKHLPTS